MTNNSYKFREYISIPYLLTKVLMSNLSGNHKYEKETYHYGSDKKQNIIIIKPRHSQRKNAAIFFYHGGGWKQGSSNAFRFVGYFFASLGYTTIVADYRKVPKNTFPAQIEDTVSAFKLGIKRLKGQGSCFDKVILVGQSAGAHLAAYLAYSDVLDEMELGKELIKGVISISGPINFTKCKNEYINKTISDFVLTKENRNKANPYLYLKQNTYIPILCIHGDCDPLVEPTNSESFVNKINEIYSGLGKLLIIKGGLHSNLTKLFWRRMKEYTVINDWIEKTIASGIHNMRSQ